MASLYLDHNVSLHVIPPLRSAGHDFTNARDTSQTRLSDDVQLLAAVQAGRTLVTHNRSDFILLHDGWTTWPAAFGLALPAHPGILVLDPSPYGELTGALGQILDQVSVELLRN